ncbi:MAG: Holliday junction resolvase RuvX [Myxococcota bacterium]
MSEAQSPYLGVDVGSRRIGLATSDVGCSFAFPKETVDARSTRKAAGYIKALALEMNTHTIVVGWPLTLDGEEGRAVDRVRTFLEHLREAFERDDEPMPDVVKWDERLTTTAAESFLIGADVRRRRRKEVVDQIAASHILKGYLDSLN